jgi:hypothetical protein
MATLSALHYADIHPLYPCITLLLSGFLIYAGFSPRGGQKL